MHLEDADRRRIAGRARTLLERVEQQPDAASGESSEPIDEYLSDWRENVAGGDATKFQERLERLGLAAESLPDQLPTGAWPTDEQLPDWVDEIDGLLDAVSTAGRSDLKLRTEDDPPIAFEALVAAVVDYSDGKVEWKRTQLAQSAIDSFREQLANDVVSLCSHSLFIEFKTFVAERDPDLAFADDPSGASSQQEYYESFIETMLDGNLADFFVEYALLARRLALTIRSWVERVEEFTTRVANDRPAIRDTFTEGTDPGCVVSLEVRGDPHDGGRTTMEVRFESGLRLAYKPRSVGVASTFFDTIRWLNDRTEGLDLRPLVVLERDQYGWVEWVDREPVSSTDAVRRYYRRTGRLTCLLYALRFSDGHFENVVATDDQPVLIDLETAVRPPSPGETEDGTGTGAFRQSTVLETGLLPEQTNVGGVEADDERVPDIGGFGSPEATWTGLQIPEFTDVNTDAMELRFRDQQTEGQNNLPLLDGTPVGPNEYASALVAGFETMHRELREHRAELLGEDGPVAEFEGESVRLLVRPTRWYGKLLRQGQTPSKLRSGLAFGSRMELLAKAMVVYDDPEVVPAVYSAERRALVRRDVPRFSARTDENALRHDGEPIVESYFDGTAMEAIRSRIEALDATDVATQRDYLRLAFGQKVWREDDSTSPPSAEARDLSPVDSARQIYERILEDATTTSSGDRTWVLENTRDNGFNAELIGANLYQGRVGIGLFGAALYQVTGDESYHKFVEAVLEPVVEAVNEGPRQRRPLGIAGDGSVVYGCTTIGRLLDDRRFLTIARAASANLTRDRLQSDTAYDMLQGNAGAICGLLKLYDETDDEAVLERARIAGDHLLANRIEAAGCQVWPSNTEGDPLQGAAHGVAGVAYSLSRLADATSEKRFERAALESLRFENRHYDANRSNWLDRRDGGSAAATTWCHGRAGIGLLRLGMSSYVDDERVTRDIDRALENVAASSVMKRDHCCCGNAGRIELLLEGGRHRNSTHERQARSLAARCEARAESAGYFRTPFTNGRLHDPTFFMGEAGIGYTLLRLVDATLPCVLQLE